MGLIIMGLHDYLPDHLILNRNHFCMSGFIRNDIQ
jgi:hypothetical protein